MSSILRLVMTSLWFDTQAPSWLPWGRVRKYRIDSAVDIFSARPLISICRSSSVHGNSRQTLGLPSISRAFWLP